MLQDVLDFSFIAAAVMAWRSPVDWLVKLYLSTQMTSVALYLWLKLYPPTDNYSAAYAYIWWELTAIQFIAAVVAASSAWRDPVSHIVLASWALWFVWLSGYLANPASTAWDWCPDAIFITACLVIRRAAWAQTRRETSSPSIS